MAAVCLLTAGVVAVVDPERSAIIGAFMRVGLVMGALWLALPAAGGRVGWRVAGPIVVAVAVVAGVVKNARVLVVLVPILLVIGALMVVFRPRPPEQSGPRRKR